MTFSIPEVDQLGWGQPLKDHLAQLNDPQFGGFNIVENIEERNSRFWDNGVVDRDAYVNKTIYVKETGSFFVWQISSNPSNNRVWKELQKTVTNGEWITSSGTFSSEGAQTCILNGVSLSQLSLKQGDSVKVNDVIYNILTILDDYSFLTDRYTVSYYISNLPWYEPRYTNNHTYSPATITVNGFNVTFSIDPSTFGGIEPGDCLYLHSAVTNYATQFYSRVVAVNGNTVTVEHSTTNEIFSGGWAIHKKYKSSPFSYGYALHKWQEGGRSLVITRDGILSNSNGNIKLINSDDFSQLVLSPTGLNISNRNRPGRGYASGFLVSVLADNQPEWPVNTSGDIVIATQFDEVPSGSTVNWTVFNTNTQNKIAFRMNTGVNGEYKTINDSILVLERRRAGVLINNPSETFHVNGNILATGTIISGSDRRWKKDITKIDSALDKVISLEGVHYFWIEEEQERRGKDKQIGLIAQNVEEVFPEAIKKDNEGYMSVNYDGLVGALVEAIKEQQVMINDLKAEVTELKAKLA